MKHSNNKPNPSKPGHEVKEKEVVQNPMPEKKKSAYQSSKDDTAKEL